MKARKSARVALLSAAALLLGATSVYANTATVSSTIKFLTDISFTVTNMNFGAVEAGTAATYTLTTAGALSTVGGISEGGSHNAADVLIKGSGASTINISVGNEVADGSVTIGSETCAYDGGASGSCTITAAAAPGSAGKHLLIGATVTADGSEADGDVRHPTFDVTVVYP